MQKSALARARSLLPTIIITTTTTMTTTTSTINRRDCVFARPWRLINRFARRISRDDAARRNNIILYTAGPLLYYYTRTLANKSDRCYPVSSTRGKVQRNVNSRL